MQKDATQVVQRCDKCQWFGNVQHVSTEHLTNITSPWPFSIWGIDILGPLPPSKKQVKFLIIAIDYFTKWVEAKPLAVITKAKIQHFLWKTSSIGSGFHELSSLTMDESLKAISSRIFARSWG